MSDRIRQIVGGLAMAFALELGPGMPPARRLAPEPPVAVVLVVGDPTPWLPARFGPAPSPAG